MKQDLLTTGDIGKYCGVHFRTVLRWIERGELKAFKLPGGRGDHRVTVAEFVDFLERNGMPVPESLAPGPARVLITDDDANMARAIERTLKRAGYETQIALDGLQAGVLLETFKPQLLTLDLNMPGLSGQDVLGFIRANSANRGLKILVVSATNEPELRGTLALGADDYVLKPFTNETLLAKAGALLGTPTQVA